MAIIPNGFGAVSLRFQTPAAGGPAFITWGIRSDLGDDASVITDAVRDAIDTAFAQSLTWDTHFDGNYDPDEVNVLYRSSTGDLFSFVAAVTAPAAASGGAEAPQVAALVKKSTQFAGRQFRGRFFIPGLIQASVNEAGTLTAGAMTGIQGLVDSNPDSLLQQHATRDVPMVLLHNTPLSGSAPVPSVIDNLFVDPLVATQRRRLR